MPANREVEPLQFGLALGAAQDLTLTLAGVTGIIVSIGVTTDSFAGSTATSFRGSKHIRG
mgnify:CR=1 FL=1